MPSAMLPAVASARVAPPFLQRPQQATSPPPLFSSSQPPQALRRRRFMPPLQAPLRLAGSAVAVRPPAAASLSSGRCRALPSEHEASSHPNSSSGGGPGPAPASAAGGAQPPPSAPVSPTGTAAAGGDKGAAPSAGADGRAESADALSAAAAASQYRLETLAAKAASSAAAAGVALLAQEAHPLPTLSTAPLDIPTLPPAHASTPSPTPQLNPPATPDPPTLAPNPHPKLHAPPTPDPSVAFWKPTSQSTILSAKNMPTQKPKATPALHPPYHPKPRPAPRPGSPQLPLSKTPHTHHKPHSQPSTSLPTSASAPHDAGQQPTASVHSKDDPSPPSEQPPRSPGSPDATESSQNQSQLQPAQIQSSSSAAAHAQDQLAASGQQQPLSPPPSPPPPAAAFQQRAEPSPAPSSPSSAPPSLVQLPSGPPLPPADASLEYPLPPPATEHPPAAPHAARPAAAGTAADRDVVPIPSVLQYHPSLSKEQRPPVRSARSLTAPRGTFTSRAATALKLVMDGGVGTFVVVGIGALIAVTGWARGSTVRVDNPYRFVVELATAPNVFKGTGVRMRGIEVGRVSGVEVGLEGVEVEVEVGDVGIVVPRGSKVELNLSGMASQAFVDIDPQGEGGVEWGAGPLDRQGCEAEGVIVCDRGRVVGAIGVSMDEMVRRQVEAMRDPKKVNRGSHWEP